MLGLLATAGAAHVPSYGSDGNCVAPKHHHDISQAVYLQNSGGLEIHCDTTTPGACPFKTTDGGELIDVDVVFERVYDNADGLIEVFIGCLGCVETDPITIPATPLTYGKTTLEPFTQGTYVSALTDAQKKFNTTQLDASVCAQKHFGIRLRTNRTDVQWSAVVGLQESFTAQELIEFPIYILRNHAEWNGRPWSLPAVVAFVVILDLVAAAWAWCVNRSRRVPSILEDPYSVRSWCLQVAAWGFLVGATQIALQLGLTQLEAEFGGEFFICLVLVIGVAQVLPWLLTVHIWRAHLYDLGCSSSPTWAPVQITVGTGFFFLLGSGFLVGPAALILDGLVRLTELLPASGKPDRPEDELALGRAETLNDL